jgi:hypothetical protein
MGRELKPHVRQPLGRAGLGLQSSKKMNNLARNNGYMLKSLLDENGSRNDVLRLHNVNSEEDFPPVQKACERA